MVRGFERAQAEYEYHMMHPYDKGGALYEPEEDDKENGIYYEDIDEE